MNPHSIGQGSRCHCFLLNHKPPESWVSPNHSGREAVVWKGIVPLMCREAWRQPFIIIIIILLVGG